MGTKRVSGRSEKNETHKETTCNYEIGQKFQNV